MAPWSVDTFRGSAGQFHQRDVADGAARQAWWCEADRPALVLGSAQPMSTVDEGACRAAGIEVVRRRSGGGAVLVVPGEVVWLDVVVRRGDPLWDDDVGRSMWWLGEMWCDVLRSYGAVATVHRGPLVRTAWSSVVCFDGVGAGEVLVGDAKAVGIAQRRTRDWARMQSMVHLRWRPAFMASLLSPSPDPDQLRSAWESPAGPAELMSAVHERLRT